MKDQQVENGGQH